MPKQKSSLQEHIFFEKMDKRFNKETKTAEYLVLWSTGEKRGKYDRICRYTGKMFMIKSLPCHMRKRTLTNYVLFLVDFKV